MQGVGRGRSRGDRRLVEDGKMIGHTHYMGRRSCR
jgi:hypothetical protein